MVMIEVEQRNPSPFPFRRKPATESTSAVLFNQFLFVPFPRQMVFARELVLAAALLTPISVFSSPEQGFGYESTVPVTPPQPIGKFLFVDFNGNPVLFQLIANDCQENLVIHRLRNSFVRLADFPFVRFRHRSKFRHDLLPLVYDTDSK
jgi:hypothetical protein